MALTQSQVHRSRILSVLSREPSGSLSRAEVLQRLAANFEWSEDDEKPRESRPWETIWQNRASFERAEMVRDGLLENGGYGLWTLTAAGWKLARASHQKDADHATEFLRRESMWNGIISGGGPHDVTAGLIRQLGIYSGARGIYINQEITKSVNAPSGVAVSFLHTGKSYADDLTENGVLYHYPRTKKPGHDKIEIAAAKEAYRAGLPVFVIGPGSKLSKRSVYRGYVERYDDELGALLITFTSGELPPAPPVGENEAPFSLTDDDSQRTYSLRQTRPNQARCAMKVFQRYGRACAVCGLEVYGLVQAAHLKAKKRSGSDDERNALPLCANHHLAFDKFLWAVEPETLRVSTCSDGPSLGELGISRPTLAHLAHLPHRSALEDSWREWRKSQVDVL